MPQADRILSERYGAELPGRKTAERPQNSEKPPFWGLQLRFRLWPSLVPLSGLDLGQQGAAGLTRVSAHMFFLCNNDIMFINWTKSLLGGPRATKKPVGSSAAERIRIHAGTSTWSAGTSTS